jgi:Mn2+/Fe2+ NRAMP family transporter
MSTIKIEQPEHESAWSTTGALWLGFALGPVAWAVHLQVIYASSQQVCQGDSSHRTLHIVSAACLAAAVVGAIVAGWEFFRGGGGLPSEREGGLKARRRFLSAECLLTSLLFAVVIIAQWTVVAAVPPCPP